MILITSANLRWSKRYSKHRSASGGIVYGGEADGGTTDVLQRSASGGIVYGGSASGVIKFVERSASGGIVYGGSANIIEDITIADPTDIANLVNWLDATDANTLYADTGKTTLAAIDGTVAAWEDKSAFGHDFTNSLASQPIRKSGYLQFDADTYLGGDWRGSFASVDAITVFAVVEDKTGAAETLFFDNPSFTEFRLRGLITSVNAWGRRTSSGSIGSASASYVAANKNAIWMQVDYAGSNTVKVQVNDGTIAESGAMVGSGANTLAGALQLHSTSTTTTFRYLEMVAYNRALSTAEIEAVKEYLTTKHSL